MYNQNDNLYKVPAPNELSEREKEDAMGGYLMMFASVAAGLPLPIINLIAAIIYYVVNSSKSRFIHFHSLQSLITQIPVSLLNASLVFVAISNYKDIKSLIVEDSFWWFFSSVIFINLIYLVFSIVAAVKARGGKVYKFALFGMICFEQVYGPNNNKIYKKEPLNE